MKYVFTVPSNKENIFILTYFYLLKKKTKKHTSISRKRTAIFHNNRKITNFKRDSSYAMFSDKILFIDLVQSESAHSITKNYLYEDSFNVNEINL